METEQFGINKREIDDFRLSRTTAVKNKQPALKQISAEQILREAQALQNETYNKPTKQIITDKQELEDYQLTKRKQFEDLVRRMRWNFRIWLKYSQWEEQQKDFRRSRSIFERSLDVDYRNIQTWLCYAEMEMRNSFISHARNIWDRATKLLPRDDQLWYKYIHMEEILGNISGARKIFDRWMASAAGHQGWNNLINFEIRNGEIEYARKIYEKYIHNHSEIESWIKYAKFETKYGKESNVRAIYERSLVELGTQTRSKDLFIAFAKFETKCQEYTRARLIYKYCMTFIPHNQLKGFFEHYLTFEKQFGDQQGLENAILNKKRFEYENEMQRSPISYETGFDYIRLEESLGDVDTIRKLYERLITHQPPAYVKQLWKNYVYIWISYALFEELEMNNMQKALEIYNTLLNFIPHTVFTFTKIWILAAQLNIRKGDFNGFRRLFSQALNICPNKKIYKKYIEIEFYMGNINQCREIYEKYILHHPSNSEAWIKYAEMEVTVKENIRAKEIYELAIKQPILDMPEIVWKAYINYEILQMNRKGARELYERLVTKNSHIKVWLGFADFESNPLTLFCQKSKKMKNNDDSEKEESREYATRAIYERAYKCIRDKKPICKNEILMLFEAWRNFENKCISESSEMSLTRIEELYKKMPRRVKCKRLLYSDKGCEVGTQEYWDYVFAETEVVAPGFKLLEAAYKWKKKHARLIDSRA